jgi:hypothetical protein
MATIFHEFILMSTGRSRSLVGGQAYQQIPHTSAQVSFLLALWHDYFSGIGIVPVHLAIRLPGMSHLDNISPHFNQRTKMKKLNTLQVKIGGH